MTLRSVDVRRLTERVRERESAALLGPDINEALSPTVNKLLLGSNAMDHEQGHGIGNEH